MKMYKRYNVTLSSSAAVERLFSQGGLIFTPNDYSWQQCFGFFFLNQIQIQSNPNSPGFLRDLDLPYFSMAWIWIGFDPHKKKPGFFQIKSKSFIKICFGFFSNLEFFSCTTQPLFSIYLSCRLQTLHLILCKTRHLLFTVLLDWKISWFRHRILKLLVCKECYQLAVFSTRH